MPSTIITPEDLQLFRHELLAEIKKLLDRHESQPTVRKKWLRGVEVRKLLSISTATLYNMRISGALPFSKIGNMFYYSYDDINKILLSNKQEGFDTLLSKH